uniref:Uncharacterized protein n=1 Tax=Micrurus lemniscatus lemniscatus TaxID=129467 RepID=A0A2D4JA80_MICLE
METERQKRTLQELPTLEGSASSLKQQQSTCNEARDFSRTETNLREMLLFMVISIPLFISVCIQLQLQLYTNSKSIQPMEGILLSKQTCLLKPFIYFQAAAIQISIKCTNT